MRVAVVGCGTIARRSHLGGLRSAGAQVVAFASRSRRSAEEAARLAGDGEVVDDWRDLLARSDVDAFDVCTPNASHAEISIAALQAGKHVLVEKPMACSVEDADRMVEAARRAGTVLMPAHNSRFSGPFVAMRAAVARGEAGTIRAFRCAWGHGGPEGWAPDARWFRDRAEAGGGALIDLGVHAADVLRSVLADEPVTVSALLAGGGSDGVEDLAQLVVGFAGGAIGSLQASWAVASGSDHQLTLQGTEATLHLDGRTPPTLFPGGGGDPVRLPKPEDTPGLFDAFVKAAGRGRAPIPSAADGRAAVALVEAAYRSAASGRREPVDAGAGSR